MTVGREPVNLLFVCTANQCRSPMAAAIARYELTRRAVPGQVSSAGFLEGGHPAASGAIRACADRGLDISGHASTQVDPDGLARADLIVTMEGTHVLDLAAIDPVAARRTIPFGVAVEEAERSSTAPLGPDGLREWVEATRRDLATVLDPRHDVPDPMGRPTRRFRQTADLLAQGVGRLFDSWFGPIDG